MALLTDPAWQAVQDLARRYGVSPDAVAELLRAVANGGGTMAQFHVPELGGAGQWMAGGMTMVGDMFNHALKARVDGLCRELSALLANGNPFVPDAPAAPSPAGWQSQQQGGGGAGWGWWPAGLGQPNGSGGQNDMRYAYFHAARRLAVDHGGRVTVYDTLDHHIGGVQQQQSGGGSTLTFASQYGTVPVSSLPVVGPDGSAAQATTVPAPVAPTGGDDIFAKIEQLAQLRQKGYISEDEFAAKKAELLGRL